MHMLLAFLASAVLRHVSVHRHIHRLSWSSVRLLCSAEGDVALNTVLFSKSYQPL